MESLGTTLLQLMGLVIFGGIWMWMKKKMDKEEQAQAQIDTLKNRAEVQSEIVEENRKTEEESKEGEKELREDLED